jgi:hypothetical protein
MDNFAQSTADAILGVGVLISKLKEIGNTKVGGALFDVKNIPVLGAYLAGFSELGAAQRAKTAPSNSEGRSSSRIYLQQLRLESKASKDLTNAKKKETASSKAKSEVDKLAERFDVERIGLLKALNEATDADTRLRILSKIAILDNNEALAKKYNAEWKAADQAEKLADAFVKAGNAALYFKDWADYRAGERGDAASMSNVPSSGGGGGGGFTPSAPFAMGAVQRGEYSDVTVNVNANTIVSDEELKGLITDTVRVALKSGNKLIPAGSIL